MSHTLAYILGIVILIIGIGLSVALHELGHMLPAKHFGVKVPEYFIGFGPRLWSTRRGETEYGIKAIWLGGYVRLLGMLPPARPGHPDKPGSMVAEARAESLAELGPDEQDRAFYRLSTPRKLLVMAGGILTNLALGIICLTLALGVIGQPALTSTLTSVAECVSSDIDAGAACTDADPASPAAAAGLRAGDTIVSWDGETTSTWADVQTAIGAAGTEPAVVVVKRDGEELTLTVTAVEVPRTVYNADGVPATDAEGEVVKQLRPYVGIGPALGTVRTPPGEIPQVVGSAVGLTLKAIATLPAGLYHAVAAGLGLEERNAEGLVSLVGVGRIAGEVSSAGTGTDAGLPFSMRLFYMLSLLGSLNLALFAFNLVPLLPLDGGHVAGACWEGLRRLWARARGNPDPGYADTARMLPVGQVVFYLLIVMAVVLIWVDIVAPI
ncbi:zinc metalloprotease [Actinomyces sp. 432]|uniref:M50 family metallopeptidase n=1 Tax=Actinomyces sp. 432 TaxID=2057798 RepID=UPI0013741A7E|nr:site-2 protease family protein [Actinomyces sp. 432]QHO91265.1 zinc metalloprotease [Actinomyces sp. 432]